MSLFIPSYGQGFARSAAESENPGLWQGLIHQWLPHLGPTGTTWRDWAGWQYHGTLVDGPTWVVGRHGWANRFAAAKCEVLITSPKATCAIGSGWILFARSNVIVNWAGLLSSRDGVGGTRRTYFRIGGADNWYVNFDDDATQYWNFGTNIDGLPLNEWHHAIVTWDATAGAITGYWDGKQTGSRAGAGAWTGDVFEDLAIGRYRHSTNYVSNCDVAACAFWDRQLLQSEAMLLATDPYAIVRPRRRVYAAAAAAPAFGGVNQIIGGGVCV